LRKDTLHDLVEFEKYTSFDDCSLDAVKIRETIVVDINMTTPAVNICNKITERYTIDGFEQTNYV
jgi:hypothetical protein